MKKKFKIIIVGLILAIGIFFINWTKPPKIEPGTKVIIIGGTSGIGEALAYEFSSRGYTVGITGRRVHLLKSISEKIGKNIFTKPMDVMKFEEAQKALEELISDMGGMDIIVINAGVSNSSLKWEEQKIILDTNITGFAAMAAKATEYFTRVGHGHIVGTSSLWAFRGSARSPSYSASKAFVSNYLEALRFRFTVKNIPIFVSEIQPGLVDTAMTKNMKYPKSSPEEVAVQIVDSIEKKESHAWVISKWIIAAWLNKYLPDFAILKAWKFLDSAYN